MEVKWSQVKNVFQEGGNDPLLEAAVSSVVSEEMTFGFDNV